VLCRCVCVKESVYERESVAREKRRSKISWWSAPPPFFGFFWFLLPQKFFFNQLFLFRSSFVSFSRCSMFS